MSPATIDVSLKSAPIHRLDIATAFNGLEKPLQRYAHHLSKAAWYGSRIIMRQVSPEAEKIFDLILELYQSCSGSWAALADACGVSASECQAFLEYAATFLSNVGNYYGSGDQKFVPSVSPQTLEKLAGASSGALTLYHDIRQEMFAAPPYGLGFDSYTAQSAYYIGDTLSYAEVKAVSKVLERHNIFPENTRIRKVSKRNDVIYEVLQASTIELTQELSSTDSTEPQVRLVGSDHVQQLAKICEELRLAAKYASNEHQRQFLAKYIESFETGSLDSYRESLQTWVADKSPTVENIFGFVEPYRDPYGVRAEFEGLVAIADAQETMRLKSLVDRSSKFIRRLPWAVGTEENDGKGPFEKTLFEPPDLTSINALAYCSSIVFPGINLPNYNDIRQTHGFKNVIIANRMSAESNHTTQSPFVAPTEATAFQKHLFPAYYIWVVLHELLGHGTGKLLCEESPGKFNFDTEHPPIDPLTSSPVRSWYRLGQSWTGQFQDLATTVDECRAELVGAYLMDDKELLAIFGHTDNTETTADDVTHNIYMQLGVDGLTGLQNYNIDAGKWGQAHSQAHFATLQWLLTDGHGFMSIKVDKHAGTLNVVVDRSKIITHGKPSLGRMLLRLHMYRSTADVNACREYYQELSRVDGEYLTWRELVLRQNKPKWKFVQANTFAEQDGSVLVKEYDATNAGIIQSWAERDC
ncbi:MAG: hypothetical protein Q9162_007285 [Coniocarpon cinnabarinum]